MSRLNFFTQTRVYSGQQQNDDDPFRVHKNLKNFVSKFAFSAAASAIGFGHG